MKRACHLPTAYVLGQVCEKNNIYVYIYFNNLSTKTCKTRKNYKNNPEKKRLSETPVFHDVERC
jgi:hypothetical protein